jgi:chaperonin GroES
MVPGMSELDVPVSDPRLRHPHRTVNRAAWHVLRDGELYPAADRILVLPDQPAEQWASGLHKPTTAEDARRPVTGTVLRVGPTRRDVAGGDRVLFRQWGGTEVVVAGRLLLILPARDVFAVIDD